MYWEIFVRKLDDLPSCGWPAGKDEAFELSWGWTPFGEVPEDYAEDAPRGHESVLVTRDGIARLIPRLRQVLEVGDVEVEGR
jgi:hypothetical protein